MKKSILKVFVFTIFALSHFVSFAMDTIPVVETSLYIKGDQEIYYGFAKGDKIVIDFSGYLTYISVTFMPDTKVYSDGNITDISKKTITVTKEGVYKFYFSTKSSYKKDGVKYNVEKQRLKIQRIPKDESTIDFNTACEWVTINDTIFTHYTADSLVGYDTLKYQEKVKEIDVTTMEEVSLVDNVTTVKALISGDNPHAKIIITLPRNEKTDYKTKKVIAWAYWVNVGEKAPSFLSNPVVKTGVSVAKTFAGSTLLGSFALGMVDNFVQQESDNTTKVQDNVKYAIVDQQNAELFMHGQAYRYKQGGDGPRGYARFTDENMCKGTWFLCLYNDNELNKINVTVKVCAIVETTTYKDVSYDREKVTPKYVKVDRVRTTLIPKRVMVNVK